MLIKLGTTVDYLWDLVLGVAVKACHDVLDDRRWVQFPLFTTYFNNEMGEPAEWRIVGFTPLCWLIHPTTRVPLGAKRLTQAKRIAAHSFHVVIN